MIYEYIIYFKHNYTKHKVNAVATYCNIERQQQQRIKRLSDGKEKLTDRDN